MFPGLQSLRSPSFFHRVPQPHDFEYVSPHPGTWPPAPPDTPRIWLPRNTGPPVPNTIDPSATPGFFPEFAIPISGLLPTLDVEGGVLTTRLRNTWPRGPPNSTNVVPNDSALIGRNQIAPIDRENGTTPHTHTAWTYRHYCVAKDAAPNHQSLRPGPPDRFVCDTSLNSHKTHHLKE